MLKEKTLSHLCVKVVSSLNGLGQNRFTSAALSLAQHLQTRKARQTFAYLAPGES